MWFLSVIKRRLGSLSTVICINERKDREIIFRKFLVKTLHYYDRKLLTNQFLEDLKLNGLNGKTLEKVMAAIQKFVDSKHFSHDSHHLELHALHAFTTFLAKVGWIFFIEFVKCIPYWFVIQLKMINSGWRNYFLRHESPCQEVFIWPGAYICYHCYKNNAGLFFNSKWYCED